MSSTVLAEVLDALYDQGILVSYIATEIAAERLKVSDGPPILDFSAQSMLAIGARPVVEDESETNGTFEWSAMGRSGTYADVSETFTIPFGVATLLGAAVDMRECRSTAIAIYDAYASFLRGTTLNIPQVMWCKPQMNALHQFQDQDGTECLIDASVLVVTQI